MKRDDYDDLDSKRHLVGMKTRPDRRLLKLRAGGQELGGDISWGKKARTKKIFCNLTKVRALNKTVVFTSLQHYSL